MFRICLKAFVVGLASATIAISAWASGPTFLSMNTEWLFDYNEPQGRVVGDTLPIPTQRQYHSEIEFWASVIDREGADFVTLIEIESRRIVDDIADTLGPDYYSVFIPGRDTWTGQDVGMVVHRDYSLQGKHNLENYWGDTGEERARPSKALAAVFERDGVTIGVVSAHLLSRRSDNDGRRLAQAYAVRNSVDNLCSQTVHCVVMGDLNDTPSDPTVQHIKRGHGNVQPTLSSPASSRNYSYVFRGQRLLIDHILVSDSITGGEFDQINIPARHSDHRSVIYRAPTW